MKLLNKKLGSITIGILIAIIALFLILLAWLMQAYSLLNWEAAVGLGLQNGSFEGGIASQSLAIKEKGEAIADLIWVLPLTLIALFGLFKQKFYGFVTAKMTFAICVYFPLFYVFQLWNTDYFDTATGAVILWGIPSLLGIAGLWTNRKTFKI